jgi:Protein of unknown function DUF262
MPIKPEHASQPVLEFLKWQQGGILDLRPPFQRNAVWRPLLKSSLIDSLLRGYPVPALFLQDRTDPSTFKRRIVVVDGQQRLRTILSYVDIDCLTDADERDEFKLSALHDPERGDATFADLSKVDRNQILTSRLTFYSVDSSVSEAELLEIFRRMNTYGAKLNAQELRNAKFEGVFKEIAYRLAGDFFDYWSEWKTLNGQEIAEMRDAEFTSDLMLLALEGSKATSASRLDSTYEKYEDEFPLADACAKRVSGVMEVLSKVFHEHAPVRRLTKRMWVYSFFDAIQQIRLGGPLEGKKIPKRELSLKTLRQVAYGVNAELEAGEIPEELSKATRGAANDKQSRDVRAEYLIDHLS